MAMNVFSASQSHHPTTKPIANTMPSSDIVLIVNPNNLIKAKTAIKLTGIVIIGILAARAELKIKTQGNN